MSFFRLVIFVLAMALGLPAVASISTQTNRVGPYTCTSLPATLSVTFPYQLTSDLLVLDLGQNGTSRDPAVVLTLNSDYTVTGGGYNATNNMQAGNVVVVSGGAHLVLANDQIVILRNTPETQLTYFPTNGVLTGAMIEKALDKGITVSQMLTETSSRALRFEAGETLDGTLLRSARAGKYLGFDSTGAIAYLTGGSGGGGSTYTAGTGLLLNSNQFSVNPTQSLTNLTVTNPITGSITGMAGTAAALNPGRNINGVLFDGTAAITVTAAAGTLTGTALASNVVASSLASVAAGTIGSIVTQNANAVTITGGSITGATVTGLANGTNPSDAVNYSQLLSVSAGITPRSGVVAATTANITLSGPQTIDGVAAIAGNRVLVKNQTLSKNNGIYDVAAGAWSRSSDSDTAGELLFGYYYFVSGGTTQGATSWFIQTAPTVLGTDPVVFAQFSASLSYTAGTGLSLAGSVFSLTTPVTASNGGTGNTSYTIGDLLYASSPSALSKLAAAASGQVLVSQGAGVAPAYSANPTVTSLTTNLLTRTGTSTNNTVLGVVSDSVTYNALTFNNVATLAGSLGLSGGGGSDGSLYLRVPTGGIFDFRINNSSVATVTAAGLNGALGGTTPAPAVVTTLAASSNANIRTTKGNFNVILNVKDFGALGDGSTNDTTRISDAIAALPSTNAILYFPAGIYITDAITITGKTGLTVFGDGNGTSTIKSRTGSVVMNVTASTNVNVHFLTFDGNCSVRTAGQTAVTFDVSQNLIFTNNTIKNAGQYNILVGGGSTQNTNVNITNNVLLGGYADGINLQYVSRFVVANNVIDGVDDDCIAVGYNASGFSTQGVVANNYCRARNDLGTATGRGIWVGKATHILIVGNNIDTIKQTGIWISDDGTGTYPEYISVKNNKVRNVATSSGHGIVAYKTNYVTLEGNTVENPAQGSCIEIADWNYMTIKGGTLTQAVNVFGRGIHCDESAGWAATWTDLRISDVDIRMLGPSTNSCIYLSPDASVTMATGSITNVTGSQVVAGDYIAVTSARQSGTWKVGNNTTLTASRTVSSGGTTFNNN